MEERQAQAAREVKLVLPSHCTDRQLQNIADSLAWNRRISSVREEHGAEELAREEGGTAPAWEPQVGRSIRPWWKPPAPLRRLFFWSVVAALGASTVIFVHQRRMRRVGVFREAVRKAKADDEVRRALGVEVTEFTVDENGDPLLRLPRWWRTGAFSYGWEFSTPFWAPCTGLSYLRVPLESVATGRRGYLTVQGVRGFNGPRDWRIDYLAFDLDGETMVLTDGRQPNIRDVTFRELWEEKLSRGRAMLDDWNHFLTPRDPPAATS